MIRVLGDRSDDGTSVKAERVVSGTFRQIAATISSINPDASEIVVKDLASKKTVTLRLNSDSSLKKLPPAMADTLARRYRWPRERRRGAADPILVNCWSAYRLCRVLN